MALQCSSRATGTGRNVLAGCVRSPFHLFLCARDSAGQSRQLRASHPLVSKEMGAQGRGWDVPGPACKRPLATAGQRNRRLLLFRFRFGVGTRPLPHAENRRNWLSGGPSPRGLVALLGASTRCGKATTKGTQSRGWGAAAWAGRASPARGDISRCPRPELCPPTVSPLATSTSIAALGRESARDEQQLKIKAQSPGSATSPLHPGRFRGEAEAKREQKSRRGAARGRSGSGTGSAPGPAAGRGRVLGGEPGSLRPPWRDKAAGSRVQPWDKGRTATPPLQPASHIPAPWERKPRREAAERRCREGGGRNWAASDPQGELPGRLCPRFMEQRPAQASIRQSRTWPPPRPQLGPGAQNEPEEFGAIEGRDAR